jgi:PHD/YefM family antitoxin component YafN of YafNO toxin-antitoxin module
MASRLMTESSYPLTNLRSLRFITSREGEPQSVIISIDEFASILETLNIQAKKDLMASIDRAREELSRTNSLMTYEEVFGEEL